MPIFFNPLTGQLSYVPLGAGIYVHPPTHDASMIVQNENRRFVTDAQINYWNNKLDGAHNHNVATQEQSGFMSFADKLKLDSIANEATKTPLSTTMPTSLGSVAVGVALTAARADHVHPLPAVVTTSVNGLMSSGDKTKLDGMSGTNTGDETTTTLGTKINGATAKATPADADMLGLMDSAAGNILKKLSWTNLKATLKAYFDSLYNNYTHPSSHPPTIISQDTNNRFVSDIQIQAWESKAEGRHSHEDASQEESGFLSISDKTKLDGISGTNTGDETPTTLGVKINGATAKTTPADADMLGLMDSAASNILKKLSWTNLKASLKTYFDSFYTHPATHPPSIIVQDTNNRFVSDTEKTGWNNKASTDIATTSANGLMSSSDKTKLNGISGTNTGDETTTTLGTKINGATAKTTPADADMLGLMDSAASNILKKLSWTNLKAAILSSTTPSALGTASAGSATTASRADHVHPLPAVATTSVNGLMSSGDKTKLDGISGTNTGDETTTTLGTKINGATAKTTPADADMLGLMDSAASNILKKLSWTNLKAAILSSTTPSALGTASAGSATTASRADHVHPLPAVATTSVNGLMSSGDKTKLDRVDGGKVTVSSTAPSSPQLGDIWIIP